MYKACKREISYWLVKEFLELSILRSHNVKLTSNKSHLSRISASYAQQTLAYKGVKLWCEIDPKL